MKTSMVLVSLFSLILYSSEGFSQLSGNEREALRYAIQEEKVAHDFYSAMYSLYSLPVFRNISKSEKMHMAHVEDLLTKYGVDNPVTGINSSAGEFENSELSSLYSRLLSSGGNSLTDALKEAAGFEEMDIRDLNRFVGESRNDDIKSTFRILVKASGNHLRAFTKHLSARGINYTPVYLTPEEFGSIISEK